jgi:hypothetical protein
MEKLFAVKNDGENVLGKLLYFGLSNLLIERDKLIEICSNMNLPVSVGTRQSEVDAFRSATSDVYERIVDREYGEIRIRKVYCRDNDKSDSVVSRELVCETLGQNSNTYWKLANLYYDKDSKIFHYLIEDYSSSLDVSAYCEKAKSLFELYKQCVGRNQLENLVDSFLYSMESLKVNVHGKLYFVPRKNMHMVDLFEDFIEAINSNNKRSGSLTVNSLFVADDEKQRGKMTQEFYHTARQEINTYIERLENLIAGNSNNPTLLERWVLKASTLEAKKRDYENLLRHELDELDDQYSTLRFMVNELTVRANNLRSQKCA